MINEKITKDNLTHYNLTVDKDHAGQRLDAFLADRIDANSLSRSRVKSLLKDGYILLNESNAKPSIRLKPGDSIDVSIPAVIPVGLTPERIEFPVLYEDEDIIVISKPPGLVVHPGSGHHSATLVHGLLYHCSDLSGISGEERPGIVHRLDKDTSGIMVVAKNDEAHRRLVDQFKGREITKIYRAIVCGIPAERKGRIELPIGRHKTNRRKMAIMDRGGRSAATNWQVLEEFSNGFSLIELQLESGRTHQIRVHMASIGYPVAGDELYGGKCGRTPLDIIKRQCLHSYKLGFVHPVSGKRLDFTAELWPDMANVLNAFRQLADTGD